jgi:CheY-like chemotaxis protein
LRAYLKNTPYDLTFVENGERAVEEFRNTTYDMILMDIQMPLLDGLGATRLIRSIEKDCGLKTTPIVALTASALAQDRTASSAAGCTAHLSKPISKQELLAALAHHGFIASVQTS